MGHVVHSEASHDTF